MIELPKIGYGVGSYHWSDDNIDTMRLAIEKGMTLLDTAEGYDGGNSETVIGKAIKGYRDKVLISSKFSPENSSYDKVIEACEGSLKRLGTDRIDLYQIHWPSATIPFEETVRAMEKLVQDGKVVHIGAGNVLLHELEKLHSICGDKLKFIQVEYNLFDRTMESYVFPYCRYNDIAIIAYSPLDRGRMANGRRAIEVLDNMSKKYSRPLSQIVLNYLWATSGSCVIPKSSNRKHLISNSESTSFYLTVQDLQDISEACQTEVKWIKPSEIRVSLSGEDNRKTYQNIEDAIKNELKYCPSASDLSRIIEITDSIKPVRLVKSEDGYSLVEGRIRYWAWVIANSDKPLPSIIRSQYE